MSYKKKHVIQTNNNLLLFPFHIQDNREERKEMMEQEKQGDREGERDDRCLRGSKEGGKVWQESRRG